ncbi:MAG: sn-glycerol-3-phosphate ABC transporter ATP-binding protein UgpC [Albidovulum sp.]|nr:sn-glycerol-3-phosphate ABC transporter ATP-binding protein UgpC [Albidovulum sp.]
MATSYVEYRELTKRFGSTQILHGINLQIEESEFVVLVGPSGCGKSTLLRMTAGLETINSGEISIADRVVNRVRAKDRGIAMVFQSYALYPHMTVADNLSFGLKMNKTPLERITKSIASAASILKLSQLLKRLPAQLSGGQRQRVAMGRALVREPEVFLFDEPLSNLDAKLRVGMRAEIKALHQRLKTTTIYVTHDQIEAMTMADRVVVMNDGRIEQVGAPLEIYDRPENLFVADFLGSPAMNLLSGKVVHNDGRMDFELENGIQLPLPDNSELRSDQQIIYGIRPEHVAFTDDDNGLPVNLTLVEPAGWETHLHADLSGISLRLLSVERVGARPGDSARLAVDTSKLHLFDPTTGRRI